MACVCCAFRDQGVYSGRIRRRNLKDLGGRAVRMFTIVVGLALVSYSSIVRADGYKDPADAAYCVGSLRKQYEIMKTTLTETTDYDAAMRREAELKLSERQNFVDRSIKQGVLFAAIAS